MSALIKALVCLALIAVTGCAGYAPSRQSIGQDRAALLASMGQPEREYALDGLSVLHYPRGPAGSHTYFIYLDGNNRVMKWEQVLTEERFNTISPGMTKDQVILTLGVTKINHGLSRNRGYVWHYRYETPHCKSFVIEFTPEDTVRSAGYRIRSGRFCKYVGMG
jgi:hypothetical protein